MRAINNVATLPKNTCYYDMASPVGTLTLLASPKGLLGILWDVQRFTEQCQAVLTTFKQSQNHKIIIQTQSQLEDYFSGKRKVFDLPLVLNGTEFQKSAWQQLMKIPYGKTISYAEQANRLGATNKARAVGTANARNPISIIVPCHRVIGSNGKLTGFAGGLDKKEYLLQHESNILSHL